MAICKMFIYLCVHLYKSMTRVSWLVNIIIHQFKIQQYENFKNRIFYKDGINIFF